MSDISAVSAARRQSSNPKASVAFSSALILAMMPAVLHAQPESPGAIQAATAGPAAAEPRKDEAVSDEKPASADAGSTDTQSQTGEIEEIFVTARKRQESMQKVPAAITAISGRDLEQNGVLQVSDVQFMAPGAIFRQTASASGGTTLAIRGQVQNDTTLALDPSVGLYIDDVYIARDAGNALDLVDVQNVQILKGPQGTFFGRNTTGGAIVLTRNKPNADYEGYAKMAIGNHLSRTMESVVNLPVTDTVFTRFSAQLKDNDGFGKSLTTGQRLEQQKSAAANAAIRWLPSEALDITLNLDARDSDGSSYGQRLVEVSPDGAANFLTDGALLEDFERQKQIGNAHDATIDYPSRLKVKQSGVALNALVKLGEMDLKSVSSYRKLELHSSLDLDASPIDLAFVEYNITGYDQFSQEFTLNGSVGPSLDWTVGAFYFREQGRETDPFEGLRNTPGMFRIVQDGSVTAESLAGYGFVNYRVRDDLRVSGGLRYTRDDKRLVQRSTTNGGVCYLAAEIGGAPLSPCYRKTKADFGDYSYSLAVDYDLSEKTLAYATHRRGYRSGGINFRGSVPEEVVPYDPEVVTDFELGLKSDFSIADMPVRTNVALFYDLYKDIQRTIIQFAENGGTITNVVNAADGDVYGGEVEVSVQPVDKVQIGLGVSAAIARYDKFSIAGVDQSKNRFFTPDWSGYTSASYELPVTEALRTRSVRLGMRYYWQSKSSTATVNRPSTNQDAYGLLSAQLEADGILGRDIKFALVADNLTDEKYLGNTIDFADTLGWVTATYGAPRIISARLTVGF